MKYEASGIPAAEAEPEVVRLWNERVSRNNQSVFRWGYLSNPLGQGHCFLLRAIDGSTSTIVGTVGIGTRRVNVGGETLTAGVLGDFFVLKAHRTFFPALSMQRAALTWARKNFDLVYGFPNESARPVIKRLGFRDMARLERHVLVLRHARYIASRVGSPIAGRALAVPIDGFRRLVYPGISRPAPRGLQFARVHRTDERFDRLFQARAFRHATIGHRDAKLLQWRFLEHPDQPCSLYALTEASGELRAYVVIQVEDEIAHVRDLLGVDVEAMGHALRMIAGVARRQRCASLSFVCAAPPHLKRTLDRLGFRVRDGAEGPRLLFGHVGDAFANARTLSGLDHWYATELDEDQ
jgi:hypothetical protein